MKRAIMHIVFAVVLSSMLAISGIAQDNRNSLVGSWVCQDDGTRVQIRNNGTLTINGADYVYKVKGSVITIMGDEGVMAIPFQFDGDS